MKINSFKKGLTSPGAYEIMVTVRKRKKEFKKMTLTEHKDMAEIRSFSDMEDFENDVIDSMTEEQYCKYLEEERLAEEAEQLEKDVSWSFNHSRHY